MDVETCTSRKPKEHLSYINVERNKKLYFHRRKLSVINLIYVNRMQLYSDLNVYSRTVDKRQTK